MTILIFLLVLVLLVLVHELGHFLTAKYTGMRVDEFGFGFPPRIAGIKRGETLYSINALPLGGFVRIFGEELGDEASSMSAKSSRSFSHKPKWVQAIVLVAGITANILFAWLLFTIALWNGVPTSVSAEEASDSAELYILEVIPESPAERAGIPAGAVVTGLSVHDQIIAPKTPEEFQSFVKESGGAPVTVAYTHSNGRVGVEVTPAVGVLDDSPDTAAVGVSLGLVDIESLPIHRAILEGLKTTVTGVRDIAAGLSSLLASVVVLEADLKEVTGPVGIVGLVGDARALGFSTLLMFTAFISLNLAVINILPFPALDGGRLLFVAIEAVKGSPIPAKAAHYVNTTGFAILILLMLAVTYNDIAKLV